MLKLIPDTSYPPTKTPTKRFLLIDNDKPVGRGGIRSNTTPAGDIVYEVFPQFRKRGYGRKLLELLIIETQKLGFRELILVCKKSNLASKKIIEANGGVFEEEITRKDKENRLKYRILC